jgi:hypothetical protein
MYCGGVDEKQVNEAAAELGRRGGQKTAERGPEYYAEIQARRKVKGGGRPRNPPRAAYEGVLKIGDKEIPCAVLEDGTRVLTQWGFYRAIGRSGRPAGGWGSDIEKVAPFLALDNLKPYVSNELADSKPIIFRAPRGGQAYGYRAELLPKVCEVYLRAREDGVLLKTQLKFARACEILTRGLAHVGIIALVDEATGYQQDRARDELNRILEAYISAELLPWTKRFPNEFFKQLYRLNGWNYIEGNHKRPRYVGGMINTLVYEHLPPGVLPELKRVNPPNDSGRRKHTHHQFLTPQTGHPHLDKQIIEVTALMRVSDDKETFRKLFGKAFPKRRAHENQLSLTGMEEAE